MSSYSKKILKKLAEKPATAASEIAISYPASRALKNLVGAGYVEVKKSDNQDYVKITKRCSDTHSNWILERTGISIQEAYNLCKIWKKSCNRRTKH